MRIIPVSEWHGGRRWPYIRSARWSRSLCEPSLFRRCAERNGGVGFCLKPSRRAALFGNWNDDAHHPGL